MRSILFLFLLNSVKFVFISIIFRRICIYFDFIRQTSIYLFDENVFISVLFDENVIIWINDQCQLAAPDPVTWTSECQTNAASVCRPH